MTIHNFGYWSLHVFDRNESSSVLFAPNTYFAEVSPDSKESTLARRPDWTYFEKRFLGAFTTVDDAIDAASRHLNP